MFRRDPHGTDHQAKGDYADMLGIMRKYKESILIKIIFAVIVFVFVGTIFLVWGQGDEGMGGPVGYVAKVNGVKITGDQFQRSYYNTRALYEQISGQPLTEELEKKFDIKKIALDTLIDEVLIRQEAKRMGVKASKDEVRAAIAAVPSFQVNGAFDQNQYVQVLRSNRMSPRDFEATQEMEIRMQKVRKEISDKAQVTDDDALQAFRRQHDTLRLSYLAFSPESLKGTIKLSDGELNQFLDANKADFRTPELVSVSYVLLDPASRAAAVTVTDEELQTHYQKNIDRYQEKGNILPLEKVRAKVKTDAARTKAVKLLYEDVAAAIAKAKGGDLNVVAQTLGAKVLQTPLFSSTEPAAALKGENEVVKRSFVLKESELAGPLETARGIYVLKLAQRKPAEVPPLDKIRPAVTARAVEQKARELAKTKADEALAQMAKGQVAGLKETPSFSHGEKGDIPGIGTSPELMETAFTLTTAAPVAKQAHKVGDSWYAVRLASRSETDMNAFNSSKEQLKQSLLPKKKSEAVATWLKELRAKAKIEKDATIFAD